MCCGGTATYVSLCEALSSLRSDGVLPWTGKRRRRTRGGVSSAVVPDEGISQFGVRVDMHAGDALVRSLWLLFTVPLLFRLVLQHTYT